MAIESKMRRPSAFGQASEGSSPSWRTVAAILFLLVLAAGVWYWRSSTRVEPISSGSSFQAVFLDNGQTYFGKLDRDISSYDNFVRLRGVFYLDFRQNPQDLTVAASDLKLTKLGGEVHAPEDFMDINSEHILYIEDLRGDSKIVQAITEYSVKSNP